MSDSVQAGKSCKSMFLCRMEKQKKAERELKGFAKTEVLKPGEKTSVSIHIPWDGLSCYEEKSSVWLIEKGRYKLRMGTSSEETVCICELDVSEDIIYSICRSALGLKACNDGKLTFLKKNCLKRPGVAE